MSDKTKISGAIKSIGVLDNALALTLSQKKRFIFFGILPLLSESIAHHLHFTRPLDAKLLFLISVLHLIAYSSLIASVSIYAICDLRRKEISKIGALLESIKNLPKVVLSYLLLTIIVSPLIVVFPPLGILIVFLIWAPVYVSAEILTKEQNPKSKEEVGEDTDPKYFVFKNKFALDFGFSRSFGFSSVNFLLSLQVFIVFLAANFLPTLVLPLFGPNDYFGFFLVVFIKVSFYSLSCALAVYTFLLSLSKQALLELGVEGNFSLEKFIEEKGGKSRLKIEGKIFPFVFLASLTVLSAYSLFLHAKSQSFMPKRGVKAELVSVKTEKEQFIVRLSLRDTKNKFRWLQDNFFRLDLLPTSSRIAGIGSDSAQPEKKYLTPAAIIAYDAAGKELSAVRYTPHYGPLILELAFPRNKDFPESGEIILEYAAWGKEGRMILSFDYSDVAKGFNE